jgi:hypothetical protein
MGERIVHAVGETFGGPAVLLLPDSNGRLSVRKEAMPCFLAHTDNACRAELDLLGLGHLISGKSGANPVLEGGDMIRYFQDGLESELHHHGREHVSLECRDGMFRQLP